MDRNSLIVFVQRCEEPNGATEMKDVARISGVAEDALTVLVCEIPVANIAEYGRGAPSPEEDDAWFSSLPDAMRERLARLA